MASSLSISSELAYARFKGLMPHFERSAARYGLPLAALLAVASRESRMGLALDAAGKGDRGYAWGVMQIDRRHHGHFTSTHSPFDHRAVIDYGARYLAKLRGQFAGNLNYALAAYNAGPGLVGGAIGTGAHPDSVTTGKDYSRDVRARKALIEGAIGPIEATIKPIKKIIDQPGRIDDDTIVIYAVGLGVISFATYMYLTH